MEKNKGYRYVFWGVFLNFFHINIGTFPIIPNFIAVLIIAKGISMLVEQNYNRYLICAKKCCYIYSVIAGSILLVQYTVAKRKFGMTLNNVFDLVGMLVLSILFIAIMYFLFYGTSIVLINDGYFRNSQEFIIKPVMCIIIYTIGSLAGGLSIVFMESEGWLMMVSAVMLVISTIWILCIIGSVRRHYKVLGDF